MHIVNVIKKWDSINLVKRIIVGLCVGIILAVFWPKHLAGVAILGDLFVGALKSVAPVLVLFLVTAAIASHEKGQKTNMKSIIGLYILGTLLAGVVAVIASFIFKLDLVLTKGAQDIKPPTGIAGVMKGLLTKLVDNPVHAIMEANYIGILVWAVLLGLALKYALPGTKSFIKDVADAMSKIVKWIIELAPLGVMGLVFAAIASTGIGSMVKYGKLILLLVGTMLFVALVVNPIIVFLNTGKNPFPLIFTCLKESGLTAFFTKSSAANIPVNMQLCEKLKLNKDTYAISIPLGATINMAGAAVTIAVLTLAAVHTLGISVDLPTAIILSVLSAISACGASGVAGGSLLLIPLACSLFGIPNDIAMQVVGVGFIVGVIQDSCETALNSSTDVVFTAAAEMRAKRKAGIQ